MQDAGLELDGGELADLVGLLDVVGHVVADGGLVGLARLVHLVYSGLGEGLTSLCDRKLARGFH